MGARRPARVAEPRPRRRLGDDRRHGPVRYLLLAGGRARPGPATALFDAYARRLGGRLTLQEVTPKRQTEARAIHAAVPAGAPLVVLDERGEALSSRDFADRLARLRDDGHPLCAFAIGGDEGLDDEIRSAARFSLALGRATWPHLLARALLVEQIYRAECILAGHPYHRD